MLGYPGQIDPITGLPIQMPPVVPQLQGTPPAQPQQAPGMLEGFGNWAGTPQGNAALMSFANAALQASMNPRTSGGVGLLGALGQGLGAYKQTGAEEEEKKWKEKVKARQEKEWDQKDITDPLELRKLSLQVANLEAPEGALKPGQTIDVPGNTKDGRGLTIKKMYLGGDIKDINNENVYRTIGARVYNAPPPQPRAPHNLSPIVTSWFQSPAGGARKDIRTVEDLAKLTPEESAAFYEIVKKTPAMQQSLMMLLMGEGQQQNANVINVNPEELYK